MVSGQSLDFLVAGYVILISFMIIERSLRPTSSARNFVRGEYDRGSTILVGSSFGVALLLPIILDETLGVWLFSLDVVAGSLALAAMTLGLLVRISAAMALGSYYTRTLSTVETQKVVDSGPYSKIRHPGYLGDIIQFSGFAVLTSNLILAVALPALFLAVYLYRISVEERMLIDTFGDDYVEYRKSTKRLLPLIY